jgi:predicted nucleic acid-binding protein
MPPRRVIYWDSCIFIAWIKNEIRPPGEMDAIAECVDLVEAGKTRLVTSVISRTEVFEANLSQEVKDRYTRLLNRRNVQLLANDLRISDLARELREYYQLQNTLDGLPGLTSPDAIHLATAIHYRVDALYTFDNGGQGGRSLLSLSGNVAGHNLIICKPELTQFRLPI